MGDFNPLTVMGAFLGWKTDNSRVEDQQEQGGGVRGRGVCNQGEGVVDVDLEEGVAEVDMGVSVKQCVEWDGRNTSGITQDQLILNGLWQRKKVML